MKAMILAAGRGERLRPLTDRVPKALLEVGGKPLLVRHLERLAAAGFREVVINVSHLTETIVSRIGEGGSFGLHIIYSKEEEPLETAGGIARAAPLLGADAFLLVNADIYCDFEFSAWRGFSLEKRLGHLLLVPNPRQHAAGDFSLVRGRVGNEGAPRYTYAGVALLSPSLVAGLRPLEKAPLAPLLRSAAAEGRLSGELHQGLWHDAGTPERLEELRAMLR